ncbi:hypothetical protein Bca101_024133 [Brassica carinata]
MENKIARDLSEPVAPPRRVHFRGSPEIRAPMGCFFGFRTLPIRVRAFSLMSLDVSISGAWIRLHGFKLAVSVAEAVPLAFSSAEDSGELRTGEWQRRSAWNSGEEGEAGERPAVRDLWDLLRTVGYRLRRKQFELAEASRGSQPMRVKRPGRS